VATITCRLGLQSARAALDVKKLFSAEIRAEPGFRDDDVGERQRRARGENAVATVRDIAERASVYKRRAALECLYEVWPNRVLEQEGHRSGGAQLARGDRSTRGARRCADDDSRQSLLEILRTRREGDDRHHLARRNDDETLLARNAVAHATESDDAVAERPVVHVDRARPADAARIDAEVVALMQMVVEHRREERVRARDRMEVAREVKVDVVHRDDLREAAAGCSALHTKHRSQARLANAERDALSHSSKRLRESDRHRALPFAGRRWIRRGDNDESTAIGRCATSSGIFALYFPYRSSSSRSSPSSAATSSIGRILTRWAISISDGTAEIPTILSSS
jgi:hypothetical protein